MAFVTRADGTTYQVVQAQDRSDRCYSGKTGWHWHTLDDDWAIKEATVCGPFTSYENAAYAGSQRLNNRGESVNG